MRVPINHSYQTNAEANGELKLRKNISDAVERWNCKAFFFIFCQINCRHQQERMYHVYY